MSLKLLYIMNLWFEYLFFNKINQSFCHFRSSTPHDLWRIWKRSAFPIAANILINITFLMNFQHTMVYHKDDIKLSFIVRYPLINMRHFLFTMITIKTIFEHQLYWSEVRNKELLGFPKLPYTCIKNVSVFSISDFCIILHNVKNP